MTLTLLRCNLDIIYILLDVVNAILNLVECVDERVMVYLGAINFTNHQIVLNTELITLRSIIKDERGLFEPFIKSIIDSLTDFCALNNFYHLS